MILEQGGNFEKPDTGQFVGIIADVVELYDVKSTYNGQVTSKNMVRIVWVLDKNDSTGKPYHVILQVNASMNEKAKLYQAVQAILGQPPSVRFDTESLIGRANGLFVMKEKNAAGTKEFANVKGIYPVPAGAAIPVIPADFIRFKNKKPFVPGQSNPQVQQPVAAQPAPPAPQPGGFGSYVPPAQPAPQPAPVATGAYIPPPQPPSQQLNSRF